MVRWSCNLHLPIDQVGLVTSIQVIIMVDKVQVKSLLVTLGSLAIEVRDQLAES